MLKKNHHRSYFVCLKFYVIKKNLIWIYEEFWNSKVKKKILKRQVEFLKEAKLELSFFWFGRVNQAHA